jgi:hypothetical protein
LIPDRGSRIFSSPECPERLCVPPSHPMQCPPRALSLEVKFQRLEHGHLHEVKNVRAMPKIPYTSSRKTLPLLLVPRTD